MTILDKENGDIALLAAVQQGMDQSVHNLDYQTRARLTHLRLQVLEQESALSKKVDFLSLFQGGVATMAITLAVIFGVLPMTTTKAPLATVVPETAVVGEALDVLMSNEDMEFLENLEIYEWLEAEYG